MPLPGQSGVNVGASYQDTTLRVPSPSLGRRHVEGDIELREESGPEYPHAWEAGWRVEVCGHATIEVEVPSMWHNLPRCTPVDVAHSHTRTGLAAHLGYRG